MSFPVPPEIRDIPGAETIKTVGDFVNFMKKLIAAGDKYQRLGHHHHKCGCGHVWTHGNDMADDYHAHVCPGCKTVLPTGWHKYYPEVDPNAPEIAPAVKVRKPRQTKTPDPLK